MGTIYAIKCKLTGKMYVGSTVDRNRRQRRHFSDLRCNRHFNQHLQRAFNKYGENEFEFLILEENEGDLLQEERSWILKLGTVSNGYNMTSETKAPMRGASLETKRKLSLKKQGINHPNAKLEECDVQKIFDLKEKLFNQTEIAVLVGVSRFNVGLILRGKAWSHMSFPIDTNRFNNTSGCVGVTFDKSRDKWMSSITNKGQRHNLGRFSNKEDAIKARKEAEVNCGL